MKICWKKKNCWEENFRTSRFFWLEDRHVLCFNIHLTTKSLWVDRNASAKFRKRFRKTSSTRSSTALNYIAKFLNLIKIILISLFIMRQNNNFQNYYLFIIIFFSFRQHMLKVLRNALCSNSYAYQPTLSPQRHMLYLHS